MIKDFISNYLKVIIFIFCAIVLLIILILFDTFKPIPKLFENIIVSLHGFLFDIILFGIIICAYDIWKDRKGSIQKYINEIDDFRYWKSDEAMYRIVGNIKRLNRYGIYNIDLSICYLKKSYLSKINLQNAILIDTNLENSNLFAANLKNVKLVGSNLINADLRRADLSGADLGGANLKGADLSGANLSNARLSEANIQNVNITGANLKNCRFRKTVFNRIKGLSFEQIYEVETLYESTGIPEKIIKIILKEKPHLLNNYM